MFREPSICRLDQPAKHSHIIDTMKPTAREILQVIRARLGISNIQAAALFGRSDSTVYRWLEGQPSGRGADGYLNRISEIRLLPGRAVIVLDMPATCPMARYERDAVDTKNTAESTALSAV